MKYPSSKTGLSTSQLLAKFGRHRFKSGVKPDGASKHTHYPCEVCGASRRHTAHSQHESAVQAPKETEVVADDKHVAVKCPTCRGHGTVLIPLAGIQRAALRMDVRT